MRKQSFISIIICVTQLFITTDIKAKEQRTLSKNCLFTIHSKNDTNHPLIFKYGPSLGTLMDPDNNGQMDLHPNQNVILSCYGHKNYLITTRANMSVAKCLEGSLFLVENSHKIRYEDMRCKQMIHGRVTVTNRTCANNNGYIYNIGYFNPLIEICYSPSLGTTLYSKHVLSGSSVGSTKVTTANRPKFDPTGIPPRSSIPESYSRTNQKRTFQRLFTSSVQIEKYLNSKSYLSRGHLAPAGDFSIPALKFTSYYYINVLPQWQKINTANWKRVEYMVRKLSKNTNSTFTIITGGHGVLTLPDYASGGQLVEVFLAAGRKLPVPGYIWKIVYCQIRQRAVVLIVVNNPFLRDVGGGVFCANVCDAAGWGSPSWSDSSHGIVFCCEYASFARVVSNIPKIQVTDLLHYAN